MKRYSFKAGIFSLYIFFVTATAIFSQTTAFNFQGRLNDGGNAANGSYDLQFKLFDTLAGGNQIGSTVDRPNLQIIDGVFSTTLDFGAAAFAGGDRFLEISVRPAGSPNAYVVLGARQQILSVPYAVRAANATQAVNSINSQTAQDSLNLGGVPASNYAKLNTVNTGELITSGNIRQSLNSNGTVKAMAFVNSNGSILRCYNSVTNTTTIPCGITVSTLLEAGYRVTFDFIVSDRFISITPTMSGSLAVGANFIPISDQSITVVIFDPNGGNGDPPRTSFMIIVY